MQPDEAFGLLVTTAISVIESEEVLLAKMVAGGQILSSAVYSSFFAGNCSMMASMMRSQPARSSRLVVPRSRPRMSRSVPR